jgi:hypothetical protein
MVRLLCAGLGCALIVAPTLGAQASGFQNDDASTTDPGHFLLELAWAYTRVSGASSGALPTAELYYGLAKQVEMHVIASLAFDHPRSSHTVFGPGDTEVAVKYRFLDESERGWRPGLALGPTLNFPTGDARRDLGTGHAHAFLPVWFQKSVDDWGLFGGAGYGINPGGGNKNYWFEGIGAGRNVGDDLWLGAELFHQSADRDGRRATTGFNAGGSLAIGPNQRFLLTLGRGLQNADHTNQFTSYIGYQIGF